MRLPIDPSAFHRRPERLVCGLFLSVLLVFPHVPTTGEEQKPPPRPVLSLEQKERLQERRRQAEVILQTLVKEHGYSLADGQDVRRIPPPFTDGRNRYYALAICNLDEPLTTTPTSMSVRLLKGQYKHDADVFIGRETGDGFSVAMLVGLLTGIGPPQIEGDEQLLHKYCLSGDWIIRDDARYWPDQSVAQLEAILRDELRMDVSLRFQEIFKPVYVVRGRYKYSPTTFDSARLEMDQQSRVILRLFGRDESLDQRTDGLGSGDFGSYLRWIEQTLSLMIIDESDTQPDQVVHWNRWRMEIVNLKKTDPERDPELILENVGRQTGYSIRKEERPVRVLFVTPKKLVGK